MAKPKRGLGSGLDDLFGISPLEEEEKNGLLTVPISHVEPKSDQPRSYFDEEALNDLAESIRRYGVIQPVTVRPLDGDYYQIIAGERRWRASRLAGLEEIPIRVIDADDRKAAELSLVENLQREDLNPVEEALGYRSLMEDYGLTQEEAAKSVGKSRPAVANSLRLLSLSKPVLKLLEEGSLSAGHARALLPVSAPERQLELAQKVITRSLSVRSTEQLAAKELKKKPESPAAVPEVDYAALAAEELTLLLGRKVLLKEGRKGGSITLEYYDADDRENLLEALKKLKK